MYCDLPVLISVTAKLDSISFQSTISFKLIPSVPVGRSVEEGAGVKVLVDDADEAGVDAEGVRDIDGEGTGGGPLPDRFQA